MWSGGTWSSNIEVSIEVKGSTFILHPPESRRMAKINISSSELPTDATDYLWGIMKVLASGILRSKSKP